MNHRENDHLSFTGGVVNAVRKSRHKGSPCGLSNHRKAHRSIFDSIKEIVELYQKLVAQSDAIGVVPQLRLANVFNCRR